MREQYGKRSHRVHRDHGARHETEGGESTRGRLSPIHPNLCALCDLCGFVSRDQPSFETSSFMLAVTSGCSLILTSWSPSFLIGSSSSTRRLSTSMPLPFRNSAMSPDVTEP